MCSYLNALYVFGGNRKDAFGEIGTSILLKLDLEAKVWKLLSGKGSLSGDLDGEAKVGPSPRYEQRCWMDSRSAKLFVLFGATNRRRERALKTTPAMRAGYHNAGKQGHLLKPLQ